MQNPKWCCHTRMTLSGIRKSFFHNTNCHEKKHETHIAFMVEQLPTIIEYKKPKFNIIFSKNDYLSVVDAYSILFEFSFHETNLI